MSTDGNAKEVYEPDSIWKRMTQSLRKKTVWGLWFITFAGLVLGFFYRQFYEYVVYFSAAHTVLFFFLFALQLKAFPVQLRIAYLIWVVVGTYVPHMVILMYITTVGLASNLFVGYCPLARMMYLLPWNREESFSFGLLKSVVLTQPVPGRFKPASTVR